MQYSTMEIKRITTEQEQGNNRTRTRFAKLQCFLNFLKVMGIRNVCCSLNFHYQSCVDEAVSSYLFEAFADMSYLQASRYGPIRAPYEHKTSQSA